MSGDVSAGALDVWCIDTRAAGQEERFVAALVDEELDRAHRFLRPVDARRYRIAHGALRTILSQRLGIAPRAIPMRLGKHGKPLLPDGGPRFSLSHSGAVALVAVSDDQDVGVDVEEVRAIPGAAAVARRFASRELARAIEEEPSSRRDARFMRFWTALEAILKAEGTGLAEGHGRLELRVTGPDRARAWIAGAPHGPAWSVRWLAPAAGHIGAIAVAGSDFEVLLRRLA